MPILWTDQHTDARRARLRTLQRAYHWHWFWTGIWFATLVIVACGLAYGFLTLAELPLSRILE